MTCANAAGDPITITGRYITFSIAADTSRMQFGELSAWNNQELAHAVTTASLSGLESPVGDYAEIFGSSENNACIEFIVSSSTPSLSFDLPENGQVSDVMIYGKGFISFDSVTVSV